MNALINCHLWVWTTDVTFVILFPNKANALGVVKCLCNRSWVCVSAQSSGKDECFARAWHHSALANKVPTPALKYYPSTWPITKAPASICAQKLHHHFFCLMARWIVKYIIKVCSGLSDQTSRPVRHLLGRRHMFILWAFFLFLQFLSFFSLFPSPSMALPPPVPFLSLSLSLTLGLFDWKGLEQIRSRAAASRGLAPTQVRLDVQLRTVLPALGLTRGGKGGETERENGQTSVLC